MEIDEEKLVEHIKQAFRNKKQIKPFPPRLIRFERATIQNHGYKPLVDKTGTVIWSEHRISTRSDIPTDWVHLLQLDQPISAREGSYKYFECFEQDLTSLACFREEGLFLGSDYQVSSDLVLDDDMGFFEGTFRTPGAFWGLVLVHKSPDVQESKITKYLWSNGLTTIEGDVPERQPLNLHRIMEILKSFYPDSDWQHVRGPDSMILRS